MASFKDAIHERAGIVSTGNLYRGGDFGFPTIEADEIDVWYVEEDAEAVDDIRPKSAEDALTVVRKETELIAGGLSQRLRGSAKFSQKLSEVGTVLVFDPERIDPQPQPIEYNIDWMDDNPGLLARIDTISNGEVRSADDGRLLGLTWEDGGIHKTKRENLEFTASSNTYTGEEEWFAYSPSLEVGDALIGGISVVHTQKAVGGSIQGALAEFDGYSMAGWGGDTSITSMDHREQAETLAPLIREYDPVLRGTDYPYWLVVAEDDREWDEGGGISRDEFILASNGVDTITDPNQLPAYIPV